MKRIIMAGVAALAITGGAFPAAYADEGDNGAATDADRARAFEIFRTVISMRTSEGHGLVPQMAAYLADEFKAAGFSEEDIHILPKDETAALVVRYRGDGSSGKKPILFMAHMDVVDARPEDWELNPFELTEQDGYFFGRGVTDNKYGVTNLTQTFIRLKEEGFVPTRDLVIAFSGDEETGMATTKMLANDRKDLTDAEYALNADGGGGSLTVDGKPISYGVQAGEKTYATYFITAHNPGGHSSAPRKDNAIYDLVHALSKIEKLEFPAMSNPITLAAFADMGPQIGGDLGEAMVKFSENPKNKKAADVIAANPAYVGMTRTTCVATMLDAGHAENALPQTAKATVNCRIFPGVDVAEVRQTLIDTIADETLDVVVDGEPTVSPVSEMRDDVVAAVSKAVHARYPGMKIGAYQSSGGTDGMHFRNAGVPTLAMSAIFMNEEDSYAHGLNERIPVKSFYDGLDHWMIIIKDLAGPKPAADQSAAD
ncbi:MAG: M20/M25/M40 family metallo-hydrolase [Parvularculaceae bacterium]|nr:M20/M25/M40 family metallo-hydrolase [Parvularculaceae bacterium]